MLEGKFKIGHQPKERKNKEGHLHVAGGGGCCMADETQNSLDCFAD